MGLRKFVSIAAVMLLMLAFTGCGGSSAPTEETTQPPETTIAALRELLGMDAEEENKEEVAPVVSQQEVEA